MPPKRLLSHYKQDAQRNRLLTVSCNAEDMLLPRSNFTFYGKAYTIYPILGLCCSVLYHIFLLILRNLFTHVCRI